MKRTLLALFLAPLLVAGSARAVEPGATAMGAPPGSNAPPPAPMPPLPPLPPMGSPGGGNVATATVSGPITLRTDGVAIDIEVVPGAPKAVKAQLIDSSGGLNLHVRGDRVDVGFEGRSGWPHVPGGLDGHLRVEVPHGSHVELSTASGDIIVHDVGGNVRVRSASGNLQVKRAASVEAMLVSGDAVLQDISGDVRLRTVSGDARVNQVGGTSVLEFGTTSGDLDWAGNCGPGCRIDARSTSGDVKLGLNPSGSWDLRYVTHSGDFEDDIKSNVTTIDKGDHGAHIVHGKGEGCIQIQTFSGDLRISKR